MPTLLKCTFFSLTAIIMAALLSLPAMAIELTPFYSRNMNPLVQIYGLPPAEPASLLDKGHFSARLTLDLSINYTGARNARESVAFDGETYRSTLALNYGVSDHLEVGLDLPYVSHSGGNFDGFMDDFHDFFGLQDKNRSEHSHDQLNYSYTRDSERLVSVNDECSGLGDLRLSAGWLLLSDSDLSPSTISVRFSLKLPTGDSDKLFGSGSTDLALSLNGQYEFAQGPSRIATYISLGILGMTNGQVLKDQRSNLAGFGTLGFGWAATNWLALKLQLDGNTTMYRNSELDQVNSSSVELATGGSLQLAERTTLDLSVIQDLIFRASPDAVFHLSLRKVF